MGLKLLSHVKTVSFNSKFECDNMVSGKVMNVSRTKKIIESHYVFKKTHSGIFYIER